MGITLHLWVELTLYKLVWLNKAECLAAGDVRVRFFFYFFKFIIEAFQGVEVANDVCRDPKNLQYRNF